MVMQCPFTFTCLSPSPSVKCPVCCVWLYLSATFSTLKMKYLVLQWRVWGSEREAAHDARTSTSGWKKAVGVFVRRAAQTDRVKAFWKCSPRATENTPSWPCGQKMSVEAAFGVSPGEKGEQICPSQPTRSRLCCQKVTAGGEEKIKKGGKQVEGKRQIKRASDGTVD